jgi:ABC-type dipeptide/oligopeptide/nickel transport system permease subunit
MIFHNSAQKDKYFTSIRPNHLLRGSTCQNKKKYFVLKSKVLGESPHKTQKTYFNQKFIKNNIPYAIFEGEKMKR